MMVITELDKIREVQTIQFPKSDDVWMAFPHYTKGWVMAQYSYKVNQWMYGYTETKKEAVRHYEMVKELCEACPDTMNWMELSEMYIYQANGQDGRSNHTRWALYGVVIDE